MTQRNGKPLTLNEQTLQHELSRMQRYVESEVRDMITLNEMTRHQLFRRVLGGDRSTVDEDCGYLTTEEITLDRLYELYKRDPIARRIVNLWPQESWRRLPSIYDTEDEDTDSEFEKAFDQMCRSINLQSWADGDTASAQFWSVLLNADILAGVGNYSTVVLGLNDGRALIEPVEGWEDDYEEGDPDKFVINQAKPRRNGKPLRLLYLRPYSHYRCRVVEWEDDPGHPRYGMPKIYSLRADDYRTGSMDISQPSASHRIHWTRVVHLCPWSDESPVVGDSKLLVTMNRLWDLKKVYGGGGEGFWQGALPGIKMEAADKDVRLDSDAVSSMRSAIEDYITRTKRFLASDSMKIGTISPSVVDPTNHTANLIEAVCIVEGVPVRIFKGSERGELSSAQDQTSFDDRCATRQSMVIGPKVIAPVIDRLIELKVLPVPQNNGWKLKWPSLRDKTDAEKIEHAVKFTDALMKYIKGGLSDLMTPLDYFVKVHDYDPDEARNLLNNAAKAVADSEDEVEDDPTSGEVSGDQKTQMADPPQEKKTQATTPGPDAGRKTSSQPTGTATAESRQPTGNMYQDEYGTVESGLTTNVNRPLNKPFRTPNGPRKFAVYVKNDSGNVVLVRFGEPGMEIKRDDPVRRKNFRSRHGCDKDPGPKWKPKYWSCRMWEKGRSVSDITSNEEKTKKSNCGIGPGGFQPGNKCAKGASSRPNLPKGEWKLIESGTPEFDGYRDELFSLVETAYSSIGGHIKIKEPKDLDRYRYWLIQDMDDDPQVDVALFGKGKFGIKGAGGGHDGSKEAIAMYKNTSARLRKGEEIGGASHWWGEVSGKLAYATLKRGAPAVEDPKIAAKLLAGDKYEWHGEHPDPEAPDVFKAAKGWYTKDFGTGGKHTKIITGIPDLGDTTTNSDRAYWEFIRDVLNDLSAEESAMDSTTNAGKNCGIGPGGFQPGNKCAKGRGAKTKAAKQAAADAKFEKLMESKSPSDAKAFRAARKDGIAIPPAWTNVTYHGANADIRAEGRDAKGRKQRSENPEYRARISKENNARISRDLLPRMDKVRSQLRDEAVSGNEEAKALYVMAETGFRIGGRGDGKAKVKAYGASTLEGQHVKVDGDKVMFDFPGKKGVRQKHTIEDPVIAGMFRDVKDGERVFNTSDRKIREYWKSKHKGKKVHDIRHVVATERAQRELSGKVPPIPKTEKARKTLIKSIATTVSGVLGNNPSQALDTYIDPAIWSVVNG